MYAAASRPSRAEQPWFLFFPQPRTSTSSPAATHLDRFTGDLPQFLSFPRSPSSPSTCLRFLDLGEGNLTWAVAASEETRAPAPTSEVSGGWCPAGSGAMVEAGSAGERSYGRGRGQPWKRGVGIEFSV